MKNLKEKYTSEISPSLKVELSYKNINQAPKIDKIVVSTGIGRIKEDKEAIKKISQDLAQITGQKPKTNLSRKAVSAFKLRIGQPVGLTVTLRGIKMYDFIERLTKSGMPRIRDFKGLSRAGFDNRGNYSFGTPEHIIMPEVKFDNIDQTFGFQINIKTTAKDSKSSEALLSRLGFIFEKKEIRINKGKK